MAPLLTPSEGSLVELASGVDALYLSGRAELPGRLIELLDAHKAEAVESGTPVTFDALGDGWTVQARGFGKYRYCLEHESAQIGLTTSDRLPTMRVQARAGFLHGVGPRAALTFLEGVGERLAGGPVSWGLSRLDLFCDVQRWALHGDDRSRFVCRAVKRDLHEEADGFNGLGFGRRATKTVSARIYDKTIESKANGTDWWPKVWGPGFDPDLPVLRVEFELGRQGLMEFGVDTPTEGLDRAGQLWASVTEDWLTFRSPTSDSTRSRWPLAAEWVSVQQASLRCGALGLERVRAGARKGLLRNLTPGVVGYCASVGSILDLPDLGSTMAAVRHLIEADERQRGVPFSDRIAERRQKEQLT